MNFGIGFTTICGCSLGFELFGTEEAQMLDEQATWGMCIDLFIFRFLLTF